MTFILSSAKNNTALDIESLTVLKNTARDTQLSAGLVIPWGAAIQEYGSDSYTVSSGVITLPSGFYYLVKCAVGAVTTAISSATISYQFYNTSTSSYVGRRGWLAWQEYPKLDGGDEYAIALIDASSSSVTLDVRMLTVNTTGIYMDSLDAQAYLAGYTRCEIYKWS